MTPGKARRPSKKLRRYHRTALRLARALFEVSRSKKIHTKTLWDQMTYALQSDKSFSVSGRTTISYMKHKRLEKPLFKKEVLKDIILNGGEKLLSPERRFDQSVFYAARELFG